MSKRLFRTMCVAFVIAAVCVSCNLFAQRDDPLPPEQVPAIGWVTHATVEPCDVYDGDTFTATVTTRIRVRLIDCWAPEVRGEDRSDGIRSRDALRQMIANGNGRVTIFVPGSNRGELKDPFHSAEC